MSQDEFTKLFKYMQDFRADVDKKFEENHRQHADILAAVAELGVNLKDYHAELLAMGRKVDRLEQAIMHIAQETGVKLKFDF